MIKNITITLGCLFIWWSVGGFDFVVDTIECINISNNSELINKLKVAEDLIDTLKSEAITKNEAITKYQDEAFRLTVKVSKNAKQLLFKDQELELVKHTLKITREALNRVKEDAINDSSDYE